MRKLTFSFFLLLSALTLHAQQHNMVIQADQIAAQIQPTMYGLFFEDINYGADEVCMPSW